MIGIRQYRDHLVFAALLLGFLVPLPSTAAKKKSDGLVTVEWVNESGKVVPLKWRTRQRWGWTRLYKDLRVKSPSLRTWIEIPKDVKIIEVTSQDAIIRQRLKRNPFTNSTGAVIALDSNRPITSLSMTYERKGQSRSANMIVKTKYPATKFWTHPDCKKEGIRLKRDRAGGKNLYVAINCERTPEGVSLFVISSPDSRWKTRVRGKAVPFKGKFWKEFKIPPVPIDNKKPKRTLGKILAKGKRERKTSLYTIVEYLKVENKRFFMSAGLGASYLKYTESPSAVNLTEIGLTGKFSASYVLKPRKWDIGGNVFGTIVSLSDSITPATIQVKGTPKATEAARFFGINGRIGYQLPSENKSLIFKILFGTYLWGMSVPGDTYGIKTLFGPQLFLTSAFIQKDGSSHYAYVKFAPIAETFTVSLNNREFALGGGYQVGKLGRKNPIHLTLDLASTSISTTSEGISMTLLSASLGGQVSF